MDADKEAWLQYLRQECSSGVVAAFENAMGFFGNGQFDERVTANWARPTSDESGSEPPRVRWLPD